MYTPEKSSAVITRWLTLVITLSSLYITSCKSYTQSISRSRQAMAQGKPQIAIDHLTQQVKRAGKDSHLISLLLLERAIAKQHAGLYRSSAEDLRGADDNLEVLDYTKTPVKDISTYVFSGDSSPYRPPPFEKMLVNLFNLLNYLAVHDWNGAKVEARRFQVNESFFDSQDLGETDSGEADSGETNSGEANSGEANSGEADSGRADSGPNRSVSYLQEMRALSHLLCAFAFYASGDLTLSQKYLNSIPSFSALNQSISGDQSQLLGDLFIVSSGGFVSFKRAKRLPLGTALLYLGPNSGMSRREHQRLQRIQAQGLVKWLNFPQLTRGLPSPVHSLQVDGGVMAPTTSLSIDRLAQEALKRAQTKLLIAAFTRLLSRAIVGEVSRKVSSKKLGGGLGFLIGLVTEGAMSATDTPDTRSWTSLPAEMNIYWLRLPFGAHQIEWRQGRERRQYMIKLKAQDAPTVLIFPSPQRASSAPPAHL